MNMGETRRVSRVVVLVVVIAIENLIKNRVGNSMSYFYYEQGTIPLYIIIGNIFLFPAVSYLKISF